MNRLQKLNRIMQELEHNGDVSEMEYAAYKKLLDVVEAAHLVNAASCYDPDHDMVYLDKALKVLEDAK